MSRALALSLAALFVALSPARADRDPGHAFGSAWSPALGAWLPKVGLGFEYWNRGTAAWSKQSDFFVCSSAPVIAPTPTHNFSFSGRGCPALAKGTYFVYGTAGPTRGHTLYDAPHRLVLYQEGCCAWGNTVLVSGVAAPPKNVQGADLSTVRTNRGVTLGMTKLQVTKIYGPAVLHDVAGTSSVKMLAYTTIHGNPSAISNACGQFQNFAFRTGKLFYIELLAGC